MTERRVSSTNYLNLHLTDLCNFRCVYCWPGQSVRRRFGKTQLCEHADWLSAVKVLDATGVRWRVELTGGEPFSYSNIVDLCERLTERHEIRICTNCSHDSVEVFAKQVDPSNVERINCSVHIKERLRIESNLKHFVRRIELLKDAGFPVVVTYVAYPPLLGRIAKDIEYLASKKINVTPKLFRGYYDRALYPAAYSDSQKEILGSLLADSMDWYILDAPVGFRGKECLAGRLLFAATPDGHVYRCSTFRTYGIEPLGNLFSDKAFSSTIDLECPFEECGCPYEGLIYCECEAAVSSALHTPAKDRLIRLRRDARS